MPFLYALPAFPVAQMLLATPEDWCYIEEKEGIFMEENMYGIQKPIYHNLWIYWLAGLVSLVLGLFDNVVVSILAIVVGIVQLYQMYQMRDISERLGRAFRWTIISIVMLIGGTLMALMVALMQSDPLWMVADGVILVMLLMLLVAFAGAIISLVAAYQFYAGLNELIAVRGYDYPAGRIMWCFWLALIVAGLGFLVNMIGFETIVSLAAFVVNAVSLVLLWQYLRAVKQNEEGADSGLGGPDDPLE